jgi:hypothetical protein
MIDFSTEIESLIKNALNCFKSANEYEINSIDDLNKFEINTKLGYVYQIVSKRDIKYIGKSRGKYFRQRIKSHFLKEYKGTKSKIHRVKEENGNVKLKFIELKPESVRNLIEEELISRLTDQKSWNYKK